MNNLGSKRRRSWRLLPVLGALDSVKVEKFGVCVGLSIGEVHTSLLLLLAIGVASAGATSDATSKATRANLSATAAPYIGQQGLGEFSSAASANKKAAVRPR